MVNNTLVIFKHFHPKIRVAVSPILAFIVVCLLDISPAGGQAASWCKTLGGTIDKYPVVMHLHKAGHRYSGYYYYKSQQDPVSFSGEDSSHPGKNTISVYIGENNRESFEFGLIGNKATGQWRSGNRSLPFTAKEDTSGLFFDYVYTSGSVLLRPTLKESPAADFEAMAPWPKGNSPTALFLKRVINEEFGARNSTEDIGKNFLTMKKEFFNDYMENNGNVNDEDLKQAFSLFHEQSSKMEIMYQSPKLLMLATSSYAFTGGAHPNHGTSYAALDLVNKRKLGISDIVTKQGSIRLAALLEQAFRKKYKLKATDPLSEGGLFEDKIEPNDNFYITQKGIWFWYNPYEIGPYVMGDIDLFIPMTELKDYLQPGVKNLLR